MQSFATDQQLEEALAQLGIELELGNPSDKPELKKLLFDYLAYPSDQQASCHQQANRLGSFDEEQNRTTLKQNYAKNNQLPEICPCCCCLRQDDLLYRTDLNTLETLGEATALLFLNMKYSAWLMLSGFLVYGLYALITNVVSANRDCTTLLDFCSVNMVALSSKIVNETEENRKLYIVQTWLGLVLSLLWAVLFVYKAGMERKVELEQDSVNPTASDFTVMIEDLPKVYNRANLQAMLDVYASSVDEQLDVPDYVLYDQAKYDKKFTIEVFNEARPYYQIVSVMEKEKPTTNEKRFQQLRKRLTQFVQYRKTNGSWREDNIMKLGDSRDVNHPGMIYSREERMKTYLQFEDARNELQTERLVKLSQVEAQCDKVYSARPTKIVFATFNHTFARYNLCKLTQSWFQRLMLCLCCKKKVEGFKLGGATITRAPEPEDIIWENIGLPPAQRFFRKTVTYVISILTLGLSFYIIYKLSEWQYNTASRTLSILISVFITAVNGLLACKQNIKAVIIRRLTLFEKDYRCTLHQISLTVKTVIAQLINSIVLSMIANYYIKKEIFYKAGGITEDVFYFSISNALLSPLFKILDVWWYWHLLWKWLAKRINSKLTTESQIDYNKQWERPEFEVGFEYAFVLKTCLYTAFFMSLQPIILLIGAVGLFLMYHSQKYVLFYRSSRPRPSSNLINESLNYILYFSICGYALGSLTWTNFMSSEKSQYTLVPNLISLGIGVLVMIVPLGAIIDCIKKEEQHRPLSYADERLFFVSEYERLNPHTRQEGIRNFYHYLSEKKEEYFKKAGTGDLKAAQQAQNLFVVASRIMNDGGVEAMMRSSLRRGATTTEQFRQNNIHRPMEAHNVSAQQLTHNHPQLMMHSSIQPVPMDMMQLALQHMPQSRRMFARGMTQTRFHPLQLLHKNYSQPDKQDSLVQLPSQGEFHLRRIISRDIEEPQPGKKPSQTH